MRKLAAIMFTDIVGYTALMGEDESKALQLLKHNRELLKPIIRQFRGEWLKELGDGTLSSFASAVEAVNCALEIQHILQSDPDLTLRIGIHIGDVVFEEGDVFGDGVNVASRIEPLAEPGCICVTERVYEDIKNKPGIEARFIGEKKLKGVDHPVKVYAVTEKRAALREPEPAAQLPLLRRKWAVAALGVAAAASLAVIALVIWRGGIGKEAVTVMEPSLGPKSVAVLPFVNFSDSKDDEYFSDGMTDDIITHLTKIGDLSVISRTSAMQYKGTEKSLRQIGDELGVAALLEGSVRRANGRVRIVGQLVDARTDQHLWADTYDRDLTDIFAIQSDVALNIAAALKAVLSSEEAERIEQAPSVIPKAYDYYLRAREYVNRSVGKKNLETAIDLYQKAIAADPSFARAYAGLTTAHSLMYDQYHDRTEQRLVKAKEALDQALRLGPADPTVRLAKGNYYYLGLRDNARALEEFYFAQRIEPGNGDILRKIASVQAKRGNFESALENLKLAAVYDLGSAAVARTTAGICVRLGRDQEAEHHFDKAIALSPDALSPHNWKARIDFGRTGRTERARKILAKVSKGVMPDMFLWTLAEFDIEDGQYQAALERLSAIEEDVLSSSVDYRPKESFFGWIYELMDRPVEAREHFENARLLLEEKVHEHPYAPTFHAELGWVYANLDLKNEAIEEAQAAVDLLPVTLDAFAGVYYLEDLAQVYIVLGEHDKALDLLSYMVVETPCWLLFGNLRFQRVWDPLRDHPRFQQLVAELP